MQSEFENLLLDTQKEYSRSNRMKDKIIIVLIVLMFLEALIGYYGFVWYESQFDYVTTEQTTQDVDGGRKENIVVALQGTENDGIYRRRVRNVRDNS